MALRPFLPLPASVNKFYWNTAMYFCLHIVFDCFHTTVAWLSSFNRDYMTCKAENIYYLAFIQKMLPIPAQDIMHCMLFFNS